MYKSFVSLGRYIPKYFILFVALVNGIVSLISLSVFSLLVYRNAREKYGTLHEFACAPAQGEVEFLGQ